MGGALQNESGGLGNTVPQWGPGAKPRQGVWGTELKHFCKYKPSNLKGHSGAELHIYFLVHLESIYYQIFFYSKIVPNCAVAK